MGNWENNGKSDEYYTPLYLFTALGCRFDLDVAAPKDLSKIFVPADKFITENSLQEEWHGFVWMNPPFGGRNSKSVWLDKICRHGNGIALTPDRSSAPWWQKAAREACAHLQVAKKIKFYTPDGTTADSPSTGTTLFAYGDRAVRALLTAQKNNLGSVFRTTRSVPEDQTGMLREIIMNYRDTLSFGESEQSFIEAELEKFTIIRKQD